MAKIKTRKHVDLAAVDRRLDQMDLQPGLVARHDAEAGEWEIETADESISEADLRRVLNDVPEVVERDPEADGDARAERRTAMQELSDKTKWQQADTEAALRLILAAELDRS